MSPADNMQRINHLIEQLANQDPHNLKAILHDLCTPAELKAMADRLHVLPQVAAGTPYRTIHQQTGVSVTTVGRVARHLNYGNGGYRLLLDKNLDKN